MNLTDVKLPKKTKAELKGDCCPSTAADQDRYPYGLQISFENEQVSKMSSLTGLQVGDKVNIEAVGTVTSIRVSERQSSGKDHRVEIQIEKIGVEADVAEKQKKQVSDLIK